jgi:hypothetical protein
MGNISCLQVTILSFEASRLVEEEGLEQEIGEIGDQSVNEQHRSTD